MCYYKSLKIYEKLDRYLSAKRWKFPKELIRLKMYVYKNVETDPVNGTEFYSVDL